MKTKFFSIVLAVVAIILAGMDVNAETKMVTWEIYEIDTTSHGSQITIKADIKFFPTEIVTDDFYSVKKDCVIMSSSFDPQQVDRLAKYFGVNTSKEFIGKKFEAPYNFFPIDYIIDQQEKGNTRR